MSLFNRISDCFVAAQRSSATHAKMVQKLKNIHTVNDVDFDQYMTCIRKCIELTLRQEYKLENQYVDRCVAYVSLFCASMLDYHQKNVDENTDSPVVTHIVNYLIQRSNAKVDSVRFRASQYICKIFHEMIGFDVTVDFCNSVQDSLLNLLEDKISKIRAESAIALSPLQDVSNPDCPIRPSYILHLKYDCSANVRRVCAEKVSLSREVVPDLISASRDTDNKVRLAVFKRAAKFPNKFRILQKQELIDVGRKDLDQSVQTYIASVMIPAWLQYYESDYIKLLSALRLDSTWEDLIMTASLAEFTLTALFNVRPIEEFTNVLNLSEGRLINFADFNYDTALYWRLMLNFLKKKSDVELDDFIPTLPDFCQFITQFCVSHQNNTTTAEDFNNTNLEFKFKLMQLFYITMDYDYVDITCRTMLVNLIKTTLRTCSLDLEVVNVIIENLNIVMTDIPTQSIFICDITGDLMYNTDTDSANQSIRSIAASTGSGPQPQPIEPVVNQKLNSTQDEYAISQLKTKYFMLEAELDEAVKNQDYIKASELKPQVDAMQKELNDILKANQTLPSIREEAPVEEDQAEEEEGSEGGTVRSTSKNPVLLRHALTVMAGFLTTAKITNLNSIIRTFKMSVIDELIHSEHMSVKIIAMRCLALCCTIDMTTARMAIPTCCAIIMMHNRTMQNPPPVELVITCLGAIVDPLILFGTKILANPQDINPDNSVALSEQDNEVFTGGISLSNIIREILEMFNDDNSKLQEAAVHSMCNFILTARIYSHSVISRLIVKYVLPISSDAESNRIQQYIGVTLGKLSFIPGSAEQLEKAILPTMKIILKAPPNSPLAEVDVDHVGKLLVEICGRYSNADDIYLNLCRIFLNEIRDKPTNANNLTYIKMLLLFKFSKDCTDKLNDIVETLDDLRNILHDSKVLANIIKFNTAITLQMTSQESIVAENEEQHDSDDSV